MVGYVIGTVMIVVGFDDLGLEGLMRKAEIFPLIPAYITPEILASAGAFIADTATLLWLGNLVLTLLKGRTGNFENMNVNAVISTIAMSLQIPQNSELTIINKVKKHL